MKKVLISGIMLFFILANPVNAKLKVTFDIEKIAQHQLLVTLAWKITVNSDKNWDACDLIISFRDDKGRVIHTIRDRLELKAGANSFTGHEICDINIWKRTRKYSAKLDCVF